MAKEVSDAEQRESHAIMLDNVRFAAHPARRRLKPSGYEVKVP